MTMRAKDPLLAFAAVFYGLLVAAVPAQAADEKAAPVAASQPAAAAAPAEPKTAPPRQSAAPVQRAAVDARPVVTVPAMPPEKPAIPDKAKAKGVPAKFLFASKKLPSKGKSQAIGYYPRGCIQGAAELPVDGPTWQAMRLSRNRNWGHPSLVQFVERFSQKAAKATGWHGILVGDLGQPRGGPLPFGHASHQIGLDVDVWFVPMPDHRLSRKEREDKTDYSLVASDKIHLDPKTWTPAHAAFIRTAAEQPEVQRVLVNAVIKKELCRLEGKQHWSWMSKVRPWYGHDDHIHVRLKCPADSPHCRAQEPPPASDGCAKKDLAFWFSDKVIHAKPSKGPHKPKKEIMLADLPAACKAVLEAPAKKTNLADDGR
jgi:penicillin-insensitive murein endopeptidase